MGKHTQFNLICFFKLIFTNHKDWKGSQRMMMMFGLWIFSGKWASLEKPSLLTWIIFVNTLETLYVVLFFFLHILYILVLRYGWMQEHKSSSPMPSVWAVLLRWEVIMPTTITATGKNVNSSWWMSVYSLPWAQTSTLLKAADTKCPSRSPRNCFLKPT